MYHIMNGDFSMSRLVKVMLLAGLIAFSSPLLLAQSAGIWISPSEIAQLPMSGSAWNNVKSEADKSTGSPDLSNQDDDTNVRVLAKALVYVYRHPELPH